MKKRFEFPICLLILLTTILIVGTGCKKEEDDPIIKDGDGNIYTSVTIGTQVWLKENLITTKFNDGSSITMMTEKTDWANTTSPAWCWYENSVGNKDPFGAIYNWHAVNKGKLCPPGWDIPSENELKELVVFLGGDNVAGGKLKTTGTIEDGNGLWYQPNVDATNETGYSALPGGYRSQTGNFYDLGAGGVWWTTTEYPPDNAYWFFINHNTGLVGDSDNGMNKKTGCSVRCIKN